MGDLTDQKQKPSGAAIKKLEKTLEFLEWAKNTLGGGAVYIVPPSHHLNLRVKFDMIILSNVYIFLNKY